MTATMTQLQTRQCSKCEQDKLLSEFYSDAWGHCIECERTAASSRMNRYNKTLRGRASQALQSSRKTIKRNGYDVKDDLTLYDVLFTFAMSDGECAYCGKDTGGNYQMEHIVPLSKGGPNTLSNICCVCPSCNRSKGSRDLLEWAELDDVAEVIEKVASRRGVSIQEVLEDMSPEVDNG